MSNIAVNVTNAGAANIAVSNGSTFNATVGNGGAVSVGIGTISPGNATVVSGTLTINSTTTLAAGANATVTNKGTAYAAVLDFGVPTGAAGPQGPAGQNGTNGINGITPSFAIGSVSTLSAGSSANVTLTTADNGANVTLNFGIPQGTAGANGSSGSSEWSSLLNVPSNFPTNTTLVSGIDSYSLTNHAHPYVTSLNNLTGGLTLAAGSNVTLTANGSTLTIAASGGGIGANDAVDGGLYVGEIPTPTITITLQPTDQTAINGAATFSTAATVSPSGTPSYQWQSSALLSAGGATWTQQTLPLSSRWLIAHGGGVFAALGQQGPAVTSPDGVNWTQRAFPSGIFISDVAYGSGLFVGLFNTSGENPESVAVTSPDGVTWTQRTVPVSSPLWYMAYGGGVFAAIGSNGNSNSVAMTSADGVTWTQRTFGDTGSWRINYGGGQFVAVKINGTTVATSPDGVTWTLTANALPGASGWTGLAYGNGVWVLTTGTFSGAAWTSPDGVTWTQRTLGVNRIWGGVAFGAGVFVAVSGNGNSPSDVAVTSPDGVTWTQRALPVSEAWTDVAYGDGVFVAVVSNPQYDSSVAASSAASYSTFANVANATSANLSLTGLTTGDSGTRYRAVASATGAASVNSQSATLTVTG